MRRHWKTAFLGILGGSLLLVQQVAAVNVVWIIADDMSPDTTAYGMAGVKTPNLDRLAGQGTTYSRAYATAPVCSASRSAFILGTYQTTTGLHDHDVENPQPLPAPYESLPHMLKKAGWFVTNAPAPGSLKKKAKTHYNFAHDPDEMFHGSDWKKRQSGQPFFAQFQISEPHRPFPIPKSYDEAALSQIKLPANYPDHPLIRRDWYAYQRSVEVVDQRVGAILKELEDEGVLDETVIMFFADHGRPMPWGKQWLSMEGLQVPLFIRGPQIPKSCLDLRLVSLIDLAPTVLTLAELPIPEWMQGQSLLKGAVPDREHIFAARDRCGDAQDRVRAIITKHHLLIKNFYPQESYLNWSSYKEAGYPGMPLLRELAKTHGLTPLQAHYLKPQRQVLEYYDLKADPAGLTDHAGDPAYQTQVKELEATLDIWLKTSGDQGALPRVSTEPSLEQIKHDKRQDYLRTWSKRGFKEAPTDAQRVDWWMKRYGL